MRILSIVAIAALSAGVTFAGSVKALAQSDEPHKKVLGYMDSQTGVFHPLAHLEPDATTPAITGTIEVTIDITLKTAVPAGGSVTCSTDIEAGSESATGILEYSEQAYAIAKVSGSTATCTVITPYSWLFPKASTTVINEIETGSYTVSILPATSTVNVVELEGRTSSSTFVQQVKVPATGAITKYAVAATL